MLGLTDDQLGTVMDMAHTVPVEKRDLYLQRVAAMLAMRGRGHFGDDDVQEWRCAALSTPTRHEPNSPQTDLPMVFPAGKLGRYFVKSA